MRATLDIAHEMLKAISLCHNYNRWIYRTIKPYLGKRILEVGCGVGNLTRYLLESGEVVGLDCSQRYVDYMKLDFPDLEVYNYDIADEKVLVLKKYGFDTVVCINVLEHVEDDLKALSNMYELIEGKGRLVLLIPAHRFLYGTPDRNVGHWRRYSKKQLFDKLSVTKFKVERIEYFNKVGIIGWFLNSKIVRGKQISFLQLILFNEFVPFFAKIDSLVKLPLGLSIFATGIKV